MSINSRIKIIRKDFFNDSNIEFAKALNKSKQYASNLTSEGKSVGKNVIENLTSIIPDLNVSWLLTGEGDMLKNGDSKMRATGQRFIQVLEYKEDTINSIQERTGIPLSDLENLAKGVGPLNLDVIFRILSQYKDISFQWLLNGKGDMIIPKEDIGVSNSDNIDPDSNISITNKTNYMLVPVINLDIAGGNNNDIVDSSEYTTGFVPFLDARKEDVCCFISGNSMTPLYPAGTAVQIRKVELWKDYIEFGNVYVVDLIDGRRLIKEIRKGENKDSLTLHSFNKEYEDASVPKEIIRNIWQVIQKLERVSM